MSKWSMGRVKIILAKIKSYYNVLLNLLNATEMAKLRCIKMHYFRSNTIIRYSQKTRYYSDGLHTRFSLWDRLYGCEYTLLNVLLFSYQTAVQIISNQMNQ